jgi:hypothetical protein
MLEVTLYFVCAAEKPPLPLVVAIMPETRNPLRTFHFRNAPCVALVVAVFEDRKLAMDCASLVGEALGLPVYRMDDADETPLENPMLN